jgi:hypothetical protein
MDDGGHRLNTRTPDEKLPPSKEEMATEFEQCRKEVSEWEMSQDRTDASLYKALAQVYALSRRLHAAPAEYESFLREKGIRSANSRNPYTSIIRLCFGGNRQRVSKFATTLLVLGAESVPPHEVVGFLKRHNGVEGCLKLHRLRKRGADAHCTTRHALASLNLLRNTARQVKLLLDTCTQPGEPFLLVAEKRKDGFVVIYDRVIADDQVRTQALRHLSNFSRSKRAASIEG